MVEEPGEICASARGRAVRESSAQSGARPPVVRTQPMLSHEEAAMFKMKMRRADEACMFANAPGRQRGKKL